MYKRFIHNVRRIGWAFDHMIRIYKYRVELTHAHGIDKRFPLLIQSFRRSFIDRKTILFYPDGPMPFHALHKILMFLGYRVTSDIQKRCNIAIKWWLAFDGNPYAPEIPFPSIKNNEINRTKLLNIDCNDISKIRVTATFEETFGYSLFVDPKKHIGKCVMKLNWNALHKGQIIDCPTEPREGDFVYQKLIRNEVQDGLMEDMRVPVFGNKIPFVYLKYRDIEDRLVDRAHTGKKAIIVAVNEVLSEQEMKNINIFCKKIGLDYGELDVLRDRIDGRIYIVDANNTPSGPTSAISEDEAKKAIYSLSKAFEEVFGN